ncbi:MAG: chorismate synthase [Oscillospiraceae bacterium]
MSNTWGENFKITIFGESHSECVGIIIDGLPVGIPINEDFIKDFMSKRSPGKNEYSSSRVENDYPQITSGVFNGKTCGTPLCAIIKNQNQNSQEYQPNLPRPSHADLPAHIKYKGFEDYRGGGHFSGRLTAPLTVAGAIAISILKEKGINISAHISKIGKISDDKFSAISINNELINALNLSNFPLINAEKEGEMKSLIIEAKENSDSIGGQIECIACGLPIGIGSPFFDSLESKISSLMFSIPAVKGVEFGDGFDISSCFGSQANDPIFFENGIYKTKTNHNGGINAGLSNGMPLTVNIAIKPTPSIGKEQETIDFNTNKKAIISINGRHDPCIVPRAVVVAKSALAIAILDELLNYDGGKNA